MLACYPANHAGGKNARLFSPYPLNGVFSAHRGIYLSVTESCTASPRTQRIVNAINYSESLGHIVHNALQNLQIAGILQAVSGMRLCSLDRAMRIYSL